MIRKLESPGRRLSRGITSDRRQNAPRSQHISWHVFRHAFSTLLAENDEDVKAVQSLMRHANSNITMNIYTHAVSHKKRRAQSKVVEMILPEQTQPAASAGVA
ncbi:MAG: tyrosine-type recombinase/integrase [Terriglobales bacterium]